MWYYQQSALQSLLSSTIHWEMVPEKKYYIAVNSQFRSYEICNGDIKFTAETKFPSKKCLWNVYFYGTVFLCEKACDMMRRGVGDFQMNGNNYHNDSK